MPVPVSVQASERVWAQGQELVLGPVQAQALGRVWALGRVRAQEQVLVLWPVQPLLNWCPRRRRSRKELRL